MIHSPPAVAQPAAVAPAPAESGLELESASVPDLVRALCRATGHNTFAMSPDVTASPKKLTLQLIGSNADVWRDGLAALDLAGIAAKCAKGANGLCQFFVPAAPSSDKPEIPLVVTTYVPKHRNVAFLASSLSGMFSGWHFAGGSGPSSAGAVSAAVSPASGSGSSSGAASMASGHASPQEAVPGRLVAMGPASERARVLQALAELDQAVPSMVVQVGVYEVDVSKTDQSAIAVVGKILGSSFEIGGSLAQTVAAGSLAGLTVKAGGFQAVAQALDSSSLAHTITKPVLRTSSGVLASFAVGDSVPTLGSVSYAGSSSTPVQSIQYQQSGVVFSVVPVVVGETIDVALYQSISSFTATTVGVTTSPTLQNRVLSSDVIVKPGSVVVLGGLMQNNDNKGSAGWFFLPELTHTHTAGRTEMVLVLSVVADSQ